MDEWPLVKLSEQAIRGLSLLHTSAMDSMTTANNYANVFFQAAAALRLIDYFDAVENLIDKGARNPLDHTRQKNNRARRRG